MIASVVALMPAIGSAAIILSDNFNDLVLGGTLNGRTPNGTNFTNSINSNGWVTNSTLLQGNGNGGVTATTSAARFYSIDLGTSYLVNNPAIYQLSVDITMPLNGTAISSLQFGFSPSIGTNASFISNNGAPWLNYALNGDVTVNAGPGNTVAGISTTAATGATHTFTLQLDTSTTKWTLNAFIDGVSVDLNGSDPGSTFTYATNPTTDRYVGLSTSGLTTTQGTATIDNFRLVTIPEPASSSMIAIGASLLVLRRRRK